MPAVLPQTAVVQDVVIEPAMLQDMRARLRAQRIVRIMLRAMASLVERLHVQLIMEVRIRFARERAAETRSWFVSSFVFCVFFLFFFLRERERMGGDVPR